MEKLTFQLTNETAIAIRRLEKMNKAIKILRCGGIVVGILLLVVILILLVEYLCERPSSGICLKFRDFKKYYYLRPERYSLDTPFPRASSYRTGYLYANTPIRFNIFDYYRYNIWVKRLEKHEKKLEDNEELREFLKCVQDDIDFTRRKSEEYARRAKEIIKDVNI